jgi:hypothetical protein
VCVAVVVCVHVCVTLASRSTSLEPRSTGYAPLTQAAPLHQAEDRGLLGWGPGPRAPASQPLRRRDRGTGGP